MIKLQALPLAALTLFVVGGVAVAINKSLPVRAEDAAAVLRQKEAGNDEEKDQNYVSSIRIQDNQEANDEDTEASILSSLVKISPDQARASAEEQVGGKASSVKLENDEGNVVYAVVIGNQELKVDAGNGKVLFLESE